MKIVDVVRKKIRTFHLVTQCRKEAKHSITHYAAIWSDASNTKAK